MPPTPMKPSTIFSLGGTALVSAAGTLEVLVALAS